MYHLTNGLTAKSLKKYIDQALEIYNDYTDYVPDYLNEKYDFVDKKSAVNMIHNPKNEEEVLVNKADEEFMKEVEEKEQESVKQTEEKNDMKVNFIISDCKIY